MVTDTCVKRGPALKGDHPLPVISCELKQVNYELKARDYWNRRSCLILVQGQLYRSCPSINFLVELGFPLHLVPAGSHRTFCCRISEKSVFHQGLQLHNKEMEVRLSRDNAFVAASRVASRDPCVDVCCSLCPVEQIHGLQQVSSLRAPSNRQTWQVFCSSCKLVPDNPGIMLHT